MGESSSAAQAETTQPKPSRFQFVPVPGEFTRGRWKCRDSYHPYAETLEFEKNKNKEEPNPDNSRISVSFKLRPHVKPGEESTIQVTSVENKVDMPEEPNNSSESIIITRKNGVTIVRKTSATLAPENYDKIRELSIDDFETKQEKAQQVPPTPMNTPPATLAQPANPVTFEALAPALGAKPKIFQVQTVIDSQPTRKFSDTAAVEKASEALENVAHSATVPAQKPRQFQVEPVVGFEQQALKEEPTFQVIQTEESKNMSMDSVKNVINVTPAEPLGHVQEAETPTNVQITVSAALEKKEAAAREATGSVGSLDACGIPITTQPTAPHSTPYGTPKDTQRSPTFDEAFTNADAAAPVVSSSAVSSAAATATTTSPPIVNGTTQSDGASTISVISSEKPAIGGSVGSLGSAVTLPVSVNVEPSLPIDNKIEQAMELVKTHLTYAVREEVDTLRNTIADLEYQMREYQFECNYYRQNCPAETVDQATTYVRQQMTKLQPPTRRTVSTASAPSMDCIQQATSSNSSSTHMRNLQTQIQQIKQLQIVPVAIVPKPSPTTSTTPLTQNDVPAAAPSSANSSPPS